MVEQQVYRSYKLLSNSQTMYINDPRWNDMWYMVSDNTSYIILELFVTNVLPVCHSLNIVFGWLDYM